MGRWGGAGDKFGVYVNRCAGVCDSIGMQVPSVGMKQPELVLLQHTVCVPVICDVHVLLRLSKVQDGINKSERLMIL